MKKHVNRMSYDNRGRPNWTVKYENICPQKSQHLIILKMRHFKHKNPRKLENDWKLQVSEQQLLILLMGNGTRSVITVLYLEILPVRSCQGFQKIIQHSRQPLRHGWVCDYRLYSSCHQLKHLDRLIPHQIMVPEQQKKCYCPEKIRSIFLLNKGLNGRTNLVHLKI